MSGDVHVRFCERPRVRSPRATHLVMVFRSERDARRVLEVLPKRLARYGLTLQSAKTRLVKFLSPKRGKCPAPPGSFDFLGLTHHWWRTRRDTWVVGRRTMRQRLTRALRALREWCRHNRHAPIRDQARLLAAKLRGHYQYYGVRGNSRGLVRFYRETSRTWYKWLRRRGGKRISWQGYKALRARVQLPTPKLRAYSTLNVIV